jgi:acyl-CoA thioester hydrolase
MSNPLLVQDAVGKAHEIEIQVRFADTDAIGHVNNANFAQYAEVGRLAFGAETGQKVTNLILARLAIDFRAQINLGDKVLVRTWVERIGRSSVTMKQTILANGVIAADVGSVMVYFDYTTNRSMEIPPELKEPMEAYVMDSPEG